MNTVNSVVSKLNLDNHLVKYYRELSEVIRENRGRDIKRISQISKKIYVTGISDITKIPYDAEFHRNVIDELKNEKIGLIIKIGKNINTQQIKRFNAKNISVENMTIYTEANIEKIYDDMFIIFEKIQKQNVLFVCDDGKTYGVYIVLLYFLYLTYITKINTMDRPSLLEITDMNKFSAPKILEFIMITKKDIMENRAYVKHIFDFEMSLKTYVTEKIYALMVAEKFNSDTIDYDEIPSYKTLMDNVKSYLKYVKGPALDDDNVETSEFIEPTDDILDILGQEEPEKTEDQENTEIKKNGKLDLNIKYPKTKDTDISIINYLFQ